MENQSKEEKQPKGKLAFLKTIPIPGLTYDMPSTKTLITLLTILITCGFTQDYQHRPKYSTVLDKSKGALVLQQCSRGTPDNISDYWTPSQNDIQKIEHNFKKALKLKTTNGKTITALDNFAFQYAGVTIRKKKFIYINAFHVDIDESFTTFYKNWKNDPVIICDGGDHYWGALFDVSKLEFSELAINGV